MLRAGFVADDGLAIVDVTGLDLGDPERLEAELDAIPGVVECGIFARRRADVVLAGSEAGVRTIGPAVLTRVRRPPRGVVACGRVRRAVSRRADGGRGHACAGHSGGASPVLS